MNTKTFLSLGLILAMTASFLGCDKNCLDVSLLDVNVPRDGSSKISMFFRVASCEGEPLADLDTQNLNDEETSNFLVYENDELTSAFESRPRISPRAQKFRSFTIMLLDLSQSIIGHNALDALKAASVKLSAHVTSSPENYVAVYAFDGRADLQQVVAFTNSKADIETAINAIQCNGTTYCQDPSTNLYGATIKGFERLNAARNSVLNGLEGIKFTLGSVVVFTDGTDQANRVSAQTVYDLISANDKPEEQDINKRTTFYTIGLGGETDEDVLKKIGQEGYFPAAAADDLVTAFDKIGQKIKSLANSFFLLEYCSPKRGGSNNDLKLLVRDKDGFSGEASTTFSAEGFTANCSL